MVGSRSASNMINVRSRNSHMPNKNVFGSQQFTAARTNNNAISVMSKSVASAGACEFNRSHMKKDSSVVPASEQNMHVVNDTNLRRSVSKLKIKL